MCAPPTGHPEGTVPAQIGTARFSIEVPVTHRVVILLYGCFWASRNRPFTGRPPPAAAAQVSPSRKPVPEPRVAPPVTGRCPGRPATCDRRARRSGGRGGGIWPVSGWGSPAGRAGPHLRRGPAQLTVSQLACPVKMSRTGTSTVTGRKPGWASMSAMPGAVPPARTSPPSASSSPRSASPPTASTWTRG